MEDQSQFDADLGGTSKVPYDINFLRFASERIKEIAAMTDSIENPRETKLIFQKLPKHMRRRVMSHNAKRLPVRLREGHMNQLAKSGLPPKQKRPSRKHRRRPKNLLQEYIRRQKTFVWMETHIWHAKRFHMTERWGYKLPEAPCDKAFRACYRATSNHCLLKDVSYYGCLQLSGRLELLFDGLKMITDCRCGLSFASKAFLHGRREGSVQIFKKNTFPYKAVGTVSYIWKPQIDDGSPEVIWIFAHPSFYSEFLELLKECFSLTVTEDLLNMKIDRAVIEKSEAMEIKNELADNISKKRKRGNIQPHSKKKVQYIEKEKLSNRNIPFVRTPKYNNSNGVELTELKDTINRFCLVGPLSQAVLNKTFKPLAESNNKNWYNKYLSTDENKIVNKDQHMFWESLKSINSPAEVQPHLVLGLNIMDPRLNRPVNRSKAVPDDETTSATIDTIPTGIHNSAIWSSVIRDEVTNEKLSTHDLNILRNKHCLVPGEKCAFEDDIQGLPVLLMQRPGSQNPDEKKLGYGCGWDVIVPAGYGLSVWLSLILYGARAGGLRESRNLAFESCKVLFAPDTEAGMKEEKSVYETLKSRFFRLPPAKRTNYAKFGINSPFVCRWKQLVDEWTIAKGPNFYVIRDIQQIAELKLLLEQKKSSKNIQFDLSCLVTISVQLVDRGTPTDFSIICLPKETDLKSYKLSTKRKVRPVGPIEPNHEDPNQKHRHDAREEHLMKLKRLRRKRVKAKRKKQETSDKPVTIPKANNGELIEKQLKEMQQLWLPENPPTIRHQCSRQVMGYVTKGAFCFTEAKGIGMGYVTLSSLGELITKFNNNIVLVRETVTKQYRYAFLNILG